MAGTITHSWNGTVLTITSDAGSSSADLRGERGDTGARGPQGPAGESAQDIITSVNGQVGSVNLTAADVGALPNTTVIPSISGLASEAYVNNAVSNSVEGLASEEYVAQKIAEAKLEGEEVDLSSYYTKAETNTLLGDSLADYLPKAGGEVEGNLIAPTIISKADGTASRYYYQNAAGVNIGQTYFLHNGNRFAAVEYCTDDNSKIETYYLPVPSTGLTSNQSYDILTTKAAVGIAQGGTGATTAAAALTALGAMPKAGGTFTGAVTLKGDPTANLHPATKQYVDNNFLKVVSFDSATGTLTTTGG